MRQRCRNPSVAKWKKYFGMEIDPNWETFEGFLNDMGPRPPGASLDRIDNSRGYLKGNCRWADPKVQSNNRGCNIRITHAGETLTAAQWSERLGAHPNIVSQRLRKGWDVARAVTAPTDSRKSHPKRKRHGIQNQRPD